MTNRKKKKPRALTRSERIVYLAIQRRGYIPSVMQITQDLKNAGMKVSRPIVARNLRRLYRKGWLRRR